MTAVLRKRASIGSSTPMACSALIYLLLPIAVIIVFSFNNPTGRFNFIWQEFSLDAWQHPFAVQGVGDALRTSIEIAALSTLIATSSARSPRWRSFATSSGAARRSTSSSSSRWPRPRSCSARRCCPSS